eukprot:CAMPEP_0194121034 /NCGR_PEP_ID=MMETSP0150-20130528/45445_1 /TAXON_ID=122233 /ORGANISM="Chaetoceros debilis, Strain MM31A-1" /LENGTH=59 /DNA_ID=CAMNT_0038813323 /DNA_START=1159 /DNA_END=1338 /DNA_ORIENTATION=-
MVLKEEEEVEPEPVPIVQMEFTDVMNAEEDSQESGETAQDKEDERNDTIDSRKITEGDS